MLEGNRGCIVPKSGYHMALDSGVFGGRDLTFSLKNPCLKFTPGKHFKVLKVSYVKCQFIS